MQVKTLKQHLLQTLFPEHASLLEKCQAPDDLTKWRRNFIEALKSNRAVDEVDEEQPQEEESKDSKPCFPTRVAKAAQKV